MLSAPSDTKEYFVVAAHTISGIKHTREHQVTNVKNASHSGNN
jgi:hypothetical protein